jgi:sec-independent protein translocase protein TatC
MLSKDTIKNLTELRARLLYCIYAYVIFFVIYFYCANNIFGFLSQPLLKFLPNKGGLVATNILTPVVMPIKLSMNLALFTSMPMIFLQCWKFIAPGLYPNEKKYIIPSALSSLILFIIGVVFAYYFILPMMFGFFVQWLPPNVAIMTDINSYLDFIFNMFLIFGLVFQIPMAIIIFLRLKIITVQQLVEYRPYFILISFVVSMFLTPPDVLSMVLLAVPICVLYEIGLFIAKNFMRINSAPKK